MNLWKLIRFEFTNFSGYGKIGETSPQHNKIYISLIRVYTR